MDKREILLALAERKQLQLLMLVYNYEQPEPDSWSQTLLIYNILNPH